MQFPLFPPTSLKYTDGMCVASGTCWTEDHVQTSEKLCLSLKGYTSICETWGFPQWCWQRLQSSWTWSHVDLYAGIDICKMPVGSIFRVAKESDYNGLPWRWRLPTPAKRLFPYASPYSDIQEEWNVWHQILCTKNHHYMMTNDYVLQSYS